MEHNNSVYDVINKFKNEERNRLLTNIIKKYKEVRPKVYLETIQEKTINGECVEYYEFGLSNKENRNSNNDILVTIYPEILQIYFRLVDGYAAETEVIFDISKNNTNCEVFDDFYNIIKKDYLDSLNLKLDEYIEIINNMSHDYNKESIKELIIKKNKYNTKIKI